MNRMKRILVGVLLLVSSGMIGCTSRAGQLWVFPHRHEDTLAQTKEEHNHSVTMIADHQSRALVDDLDLVFMADRPSRLTRWHVP